MKFKRILFKISGEALMGEGAFGQSSEAVKKLAEEILDIYNQGIQICLVIGGGNFFRGCSTPVELMDRTNADYVGMLATIMNGVTLQNALERLDIPTRMLSALEINKVCEPYTRRRGLRHLEKNRIVLFVAGTGNPYFSTDTAAVLRASEMQCDAVFKGTKVDGVYDKDPIKYKDAVRYDSLTFDEAINKNLKVMDSTAFTLARDMSMPIVVFNVKEENSILKVLREECKYTIIK